jgi:hypothetical protein
MSWDNFNESGDLKAQVEAYYSFTGYYPESVHADRIYRTRDNRAWCKEKGIRISGPHDGRPPANVSKSKKKQAKEDEKIRQAIEGKFGQGKRRFGLNLVMAKLENTSLSSHCDYFFSNQPFYLVAPGFLCVFMPLGENNPCFWSYHNLRLYFN